jgi:hypothetical protein
MKYSGFMIPGLIQKIHGFLKGICGIVVVIARFKKDGMLRSSLLVFIVQVV